MNYNYNAQVDLVELDSVSANDLVKAVNYNSYGPLPPLATEAGEGALTLENYLTLYKKKGEPFRLLLQNDEKEPAGAWVWDGGDTEHYFIESWGDEEPALVPPFRTCKWFAPSASMVEYYEASLGDDYGFDRAFPSPHCSNPELNAKNITSCGFSAFQPSCSMYTAESVVIDKKLVLEGTPEEVHAQHARVGVGVVVGQVVTIKSGKRSLWSQDSVEVAVPKAVSVANQAAEEANTTVSEVPVVPPRNSFFQRLVTSET